VKDDVLIGGNCNITTLPRVKPPGIAIAVEGDAAVPLYAKTLGAHHEDPSEESFPHDLSLQDDINEKIGLLVSKFQDAPTARARVAVQLVDRMLDHTGVFHDSAAKFGDAGQRDSGPCFGGPQAQDPTQCHD
jgi:hypothetical protein